ncbi:hypothetical protein J437_LFUL015256 [Ladona fulva]|uniref:Matrin-type domain-containing protein n=1 Tax=Ladona fulva TaxID=123851 RepID=A0A8K0K955_LADFU|nr:hypothetical protein J437_LFUL015256 [Ladona fulva]
MFPPINGVMSHHNMRRNPRANRPSFGGRSSGPVSPWEGGLVPGGGIGGMGGGVGLGGSSNHHQQNAPNRMGGLLPTPVPQASNLLSHLSTPEAQLAIASNLLTTLLRPQPQHQQQQQQVAPLLNFSLGQLGGSSSPSPIHQLGMGMGHGPPHHQQHMAPSLMGRYQDGGGPMQRRRRVENRRQEPYSKMGNRSRDSSHPHHATQSRHQGSKGGQTPERKQAGGQGNWHSGVGKGRTPEGKSNRTDKKEDKEPPSSSPPVAINESKQEENKPNEEDKTKKDDQVERDEDGDVKKIKKDKDAKSEAMDEDDDSKMRGDDSPRASKFIGIPQSLLFCHVCQKHMWDEHSFENHLKGRAHQLMMTKLEDSYRIKVELMRHELKVAEQQREIELERMKRQGKKINTSREYCMMCDLQFFGNLLVHRKTVRHQKLKAFLHPRCIPCNKEFATRVEWDKHRLTPYHLKKTAESRKVGSDDDDFDLGDLVNSENFGDDEFDEKDIPVRTREEEEEEIVEIDKGKSKDEKDEKDEKDKMEEGDTVKDEVIQSAESPHKMLKYNPDVPVGQKLLKQVNGYYCRLCRRFFLHEEHAFQLHCRTLSHFSNYSALLKAKARAAEARERKEAKEEGEKRNSESQAEKKSSPKTASEAKRIRTQTEESKDEQVEEEIIIVKSEPCNENGAVEEAEITEVPVNETEVSVEKKSKGSDKYDPLEADGDSEDEVVDVPKAEPKVKQYNEEELLEVEEEDQVGEPEVIDLEKGNSEEADKSKSTEAEQNSKVAVSEEEEEMVPKGRGSPRGGTARRASLRARTRRRR